MRCRSRPFPTLSGVCGLTRRWARPSCISSFSAGPISTPAATRRPSALFRERILLMPDTDASRGYLASALGHLGKFEEARQVWAELMAINPKYVMAERLNRTAVQPRQIEMVLDGARKAGLPV